MTLQIVWYLLEWGHIRPDGCSAECTRVPTALLSQMSGTQ